MQALRIADRRSVLLIQINLRALETTLPARTVCPGVPQSMLRARTQCCNLSARSFLVCVHEVFLVLLSYKLGGSISSAAYSPAALDQRVMQMRLHRVIFTLSKHEAGGQVNLCNLNPCAYFWRTSVSQRGALCTMYLFNSDWQKCASRCLALMFDEGLRPQASPDREG